MSELTKEKIYKKELEKVGGEGNNNLERIRSLSGGSALEDIVDKNGNHRFIEGNGVSETQTSEIALYNKWSLSGTHLMFVFAGQHTTGQIPQLLSTFTLPEWVFNKIVPVVTVGNVGYIEIKTVKFYKYDDWGTNVETLAGLWVDIQNKVIKIGFPNSTSYSTSYNYRIQFDLLIDNE